MSETPTMTAREKLVFHVHELERVEELKARASLCVREAYDAAKVAGYDVGTLKVVLKLRKMTPEQRKERRALEVIYLAALEMLDGDPLTDEARRRLDPGDAPDAPSTAEAGDPPPQVATAREGADEAPVPLADAPQPALPLKTPDEARADGAAAAAEGKRVFDNPHPAGDPCRAAWDEGWCAGRQGHGMETPAAYQRRSPKAAPTPEPTEPADDDQAEEVA